MKKLTENPIAENRRIGTHRLSQNVGTELAPIYMQSLLKGGKSLPFKAYNQDQLFLLPPSLHEFLPAGHLARVINEVINELDLEELYDRYSDLGCTV